MPLILGIDTGGTYTDGIIVDSSSKKILCQAKELTTHENLMVGIGGCIDQLNFKQLQGIKLVCLSTTLATNALVEGRGGSVGLILIGIDHPLQFSAARMVRVRGKLDIKGNVLEDIKEDEVIKAIESLGNDIDAVAISGYASARNPIQELTVKRLIEEKYKIR